MSRMRHGPCSLRVWLTAAAALCASTASARAEDAAGRFVQASRALGGFCSVIRAADASLALDLARRGQFVVQCLCPDPAARDRMRAQIRASGMYGAVSADVFDGQRLPYMDNLINIVVVGYPALAKSGPSPAEVMRVLTPLGTAFFGSRSAAPGKWMEALAAQLKALGATDVGTVKAGGAWVKMTKPWPADIDEWGHYLHGPDGNPVAKDRVVGPPRRYQWISGPLYLRSHETDSSICTLVTARGRLFSIEDQAPISLVGNHPLPDKWALVARDAFNGVTLWTVPIRRWGWREWKHSWFNTRPGDIPLNIQKRLVAAGDKVYVTLGYRAPVSQLDARTGEILKTYAGTERTGEILFINGTLVLSIVGDDALRVMAVDAASGERVWVTDKAYRGSTVDYVKWAAMFGRTKPAKLDPTLNMATDGNVIALIDGPQIVALGFGDGAEKWRAKFPADKADETAGGIRPNGNLWVGAMIVSRGVVLCASPSKLAAFDADTGKLLWTQPKRFIQHLWYEWKEVFVIGDLVWTWSADFDTAVFDIGRGRKQREQWPKTVNGYDIHTGKIVKQVPLGNIFKTHHHHRCYRDKATVRYIIASRRGSEYVDLEHGKHTVDNWVRGTCHVGMMPANGLLYAPPHPCACYIEEKLNGFNAIAPASPQPPAPDPAPMLERGPAYAPNQQSKINNQKSEDWPEFRHDSMRTGSVQTQVPAEAKSLWRVAVGSKLSPPIAVGDKVFAALVDEHGIVCLSAADGAKAWEFVAGARIDSPPTYYNGSLLFGCTDGWVYCLRAADGQLAWRFRAAPAERLIGAFGQLESAWPVPGSVLVQKGVVYFVAGRSSHLDGGLRLYGLDAASGNVLYKTKLVGPSYNVDNIKENFKLPLGALPDILMGDGKKIYMRSRAFDGKLQPQRGGPVLRTRSGFLDDAYFKRMPWKFGRDYARLIVHDKRSVYYVRMFDSLRGLDPTVFFTPGRQGYLLFAKNIKGKGMTWHGRVRVRIRAMVLTPKHLFVAGPPDVVDPKDPLGAFEGRKGGLLYVFDSASGEKLAERELPSPPVFNGAAAARGRFFIAAVDGTLTCFGKE